MKNIVLLFIIMLLNTGIYAQSYYASFEKWIPKPTTPYALKNTAHCESYYGGNAWVVFQVDSMQSSTIIAKQQWLMRMDMEGNNLWSKKLSGNSHGYVFSITSSPDDGALMVGVVPNASYNAGWLCKVDKNGNIQWAKRYSDVTPYTSTAFQHAIYKEGYYYVYGSRNEGIASHLCISKIDTIGNIIWTKFYMDTTYGASSPEVQFIGTINNEIIITASAAHLGFLLKLDTTGNIKFQRTYTSKYYYFGGYFRIKAVVSIKNYLLLFPNYQLNPMFLIDSLGKVLWNSYSNLTNPTYHIPILVRDDKVYCHIDRVSGFYDFSAGSSPQNISTYYNENFSNYTIPDYVSLSNNQSTNKIMLIPHYSNPNKVYIRKVDTTLITNCPQTPLIHKDTTILIRDTISGFSITTPPYTATTLGGFKTEPLNLQWTLECGKLAPNSVITQDNPIFNLVLYPNPAQETITIRAELKKYDIRIWDSYGKLLQSTFNIQQNEYTLPIQNFPQGTYHIEFITDKQHYVQTFVKIQ